ncbi:DASS family sodium-coupled anion symporter [Candidatus Sneabacter namystus]|uniref:DASS family sodium-coupled anion symporter n=1 Tax=Candidatus Sneabacter namystus TaxID=2601646 RepID=A0A5C0UIT0_9RICK|nr:DASS family sodium-coupled anion symporter [Candidatus Sneabacter namystus]QEK39699.1 DASS family sodium-coupled anion symporter [Candidatus Sneabacter namystus]
MNNNSMIKALKVFIPCVIFSVFFLTHPSNLVSVEGWRLLGLFIATIVALMIKASANSKIALISLTTAIVMQIIPVQKALSAFSSPVIWMIFTVCFMAKALINVGLSTRIAYIFARLFGNNEVGLAYSLVCTDVLIAPFIPSSTAKAGGIILPVINEMSKFKKTIKEEENLKNFLCLVYSHTVCITGAMFLTGTAGNPVLCNIAKVSGINLQWWNWCIAAALPGIISLFFLPLFIKKYFKFDTSESFKQLAVQASTSMHPFSRKEKILLITLTLVLSLWIVGPKYGISNVTATLVGVSILLITDVLSVNDIISHKSAWDIFLWFGIVVLLGEQLEKSGIIGYYGSLLGQCIPGNNWALSFLIIVFAYFYSHYLFAGAIPHISSMYGICLSLAIHANVPPMLAALSLAFCSSLFMSLTHYAGGATVILFADTTLESKMWCKIGFILSSLNLCIWIVAGLSWWKLLNIW